ncbi:hypothetical protein B7R22_17635 [Subtercola boreus]|uniref:Uncharacterized protein n=1 Tax=Subtercola boreus TaxID=120213 RepID=A0A3E0VR05_9MICO|nr:hypothetical protein [Subtercola boreus]RFA11813.1 hypothetical protein B7R22_17635 [Subtercola boreus]
MELIGTNFDSSGLYKIYLDGSTLVTFNGSDENSLEEIGRQDLTAAPDFTAASDEDWYVYGTNGHTCDIHSEEDYARIDGTIYTLT